MGEVFHAFGRGLFSMCRPCPIIWVAESCAGFPAPKVTKNLFFSTPQGKLRHRFTACLYFSQACGRLIPNRLIINRLYNFSPQPHQKNRRPAGPWFISCCNTHTSYRSARRPFGDYCQVLAGGDRNNKSPLKTGSYYANYMIIKSIFFLIPKIE